MHTLEEIFTHLFRLLDIVGIRSAAMASVFLASRQCGSKGNASLRNVQIHLLITLLIGVMFSEATASSLDLYATLCFGLNVFDIASTCTYYLRSEVEAMDGFEVDGNALLRPLPPPKGITLDLLRLSATEAAFIDEVGKFLFHELFDLLHRLFETVFGDAGDVEVEWWVLQDVLVYDNEDERMLDQRTAGVAMLLSG